MLRRPLNLNSANLFKILFSDSPFSFTFLIYKDYNSDKTQNGLETVTEIYVDC